MSFCTRHLHPPTLLAATHKEPIHPHTPTTAAATAAAVALVAAPMAAPTNTTDERYSGTTFAIQEEDHTLANTLRFFLNKNPQVTFCGYSIPHPTEDSVNIRVQTTGEVTAAQALLSACEECSKVCKHIGSLFDDAIQQHRQEHGGSSQQQQAAGQDVDMGSD